MVYLSRGLLASASVLVLPAVLGSASEHISTSGTGHRLYGIATIRSFSRSRFESSKAAVKALKLPG